MQGSTQADTVESVTELNEGETVSVNGNGLDVTGEVTAIEHSSWSDSLTARVHVDGDTWSLTDTNNPLQSDGIVANVGAVTVTR